MTLTLACEEDDTGGLLAEIAGASYHEVLFTRISDEMVRDEVYIRVGVTFESAADYSNLGVYKILLDQNGVELSRAVAMDNITPDVYTRLTIESGKDLFSDLSIDQHQMQEGYAFRFSMFGTKSGGEPELFAEPYEFTPDYNHLEFAVNYNESSQGHVNYIRTSETKVDVEVNINLVFTVEAEEADVKEYTNIGLIKHLYDGNGVEIDTAIALQHIPPNTEVTVNISDPDELFDGIDFDPNNLGDAYTFSFTTFAQTAKMETVTMGDIFETTASYEEKILPVLPTGAWIASNTNSGFTKEVELVWDQDQQSYYFTDFGLDWSNWNDFWYGSLFNLKFPESENDPVFVDLAGTGMDTAIELEMLGDDGVTVEKRNLRLMPYIYKPDSPVGYYDESTGNLVFEGVSLTDAWWDADSHDNVSITFSKKL